MNVATGAWFSCEQVNDTIWHLWEPYVDPFARCNIWYVAGSTRGMLVDTGLGVASLDAEARTRFELPLLAVVTHYHFDHTGSLHEFGERLAHREAARYLADSSMIGGALRKDDFAPWLWQAFLDAGYEPEAELLTALPSADYDLGAYSVAACPPTRVLEEGDVIDLGDRAFEVMHLPGHSPDSIGLFERATLTLFSGDAVYDGPLIDTAPDSDVQAYVATMERLRALPVAAVHAGHEPSFGRERLVELCDAYLARAGA